MRAKYEKGDKWHSLTLISDMLGGVDFKSSTKSVFICDCGLNHFATLNNVTRGVVKHCSSCSAVRKSKLKRRHGHSDRSKGRTKIEAKSYYTWCAMKRRCTNPNDNAYPRYGGRGISVCPSWSESYEQFLSDMGLPPSMDHQIDRIDNDGNYDPNNCRWATREENGRNKRNNRVIEAFGKEMTLAEWSNETGLKRETIARRLDRGSTPEEALDCNVTPKGKGNAKPISTPHGEFETISECSRALGVSISTIFSRLKSKSFPEWFYII